MRLFVAALATVALAACFAPSSDPLTSTDGTQVAQLQEGPQTATLLRLRVPSLTDMQAFPRALEVEGVNVDGVGVFAPAELLEPTFEAPPVDENVPPVEDTPPVVEQDPIIVELNATIAYAAEQAFSGASAGGAHNVNAVNVAAVNLALAAELVAQRQMEMLSVGGAECTGCGCVSEPAEPTVDPEVLAQVDEAATMSAFGAEALGVVSDELQPPSTTTCQNMGCHQECTTQQQPIDQLALDNAIDDAIDAGEALSALQIGN